MKEKLSTDGLWSIDREQLIERGVHALSISYNMKDSNMDEASLHPDVYPNMYKKCLQRVLDLAESYNSKVDARYIENIFDAEMYSIEISSRWINPDHKLSMVTNFMLGAAEGLSMLDNIRVGYEYKNCYSSMTSAGYVLKNVCHDLGVNLTHKIKDKVKSGYKTVMYYSPGLSEHNDGREIRVKARLGLVNYKPKTSLLGDIRAFSEPVKEIEHDTPHHSDGDNINDNIDVFGPASGYIE